MSYVQASLIVFKTAYRQGAYKQISKTLQTKYFYLTHQSDLNQISCPCDESVIVTTLHATQTQ